MLDMKHNNELQIQIDDVYACLGQCPGCMLSVVERKVREPDMSFDTLEKVIQRLRDYVLELDYSLDRINITYGLADHMLMDDDYIVKIHDMASEIIKLANPTEKHYSSVFFSTSLVGKPRVLSERLKNIRSKINNEIQLIPVVVFDPGLFSSLKFGPEYKKLIIEAKEIFGKIDLSINISNDTIEKYDANNLYSFAIDNEFDEVTINWIPTDDNLKYTSRDLNEIANFLIDFDKLIQSENKVICSYRPVLMRTIDATMCFANEDWSILKSVNSLIPNTFPRSFQIDEKGNLLPKFEAIGDIIQSDRFGFKTFGNLHDSSISEILSTALPQVQKNIFKSYYSYKECSTCDVSPICAGTGFHVINNVYKNSEYQTFGVDGCPHIAKKMIKYYYDEVKDPYEN